MKASTHKLMPSGLFALTLEVKDMNQEQVKEHFGKQADGYEELMVRLVPQYLEQHEVIYNLLPKQEKEYRVLDLGCGNGVLSELVFQKHPQSYIMGFDLTENMLKAYENKLSKYSDKFDLKLGNFCSDPIGHSYDIVLAGLTLHHLTWEERREFYNTLFSALNEGGLFIARDIIIDEDPEVKDYQYHLWKEFMKSRGEDPEYWYAKHIEKDHPITLSDHFIWLKEAGFQQAACYWRFYNFAITSAIK